MDAQVKTSGIADLKTPSGLPEAAVRDLSASINAVLADVFAIFVKVKNFHWHMSGPNFRDYHLMLDDHSAQLTAMIDPLGERARKLGGTTLRSIGDIARKQRVADNDEAFVNPQEMLEELREDNTMLVARLRELNELCEQHGDTGTAHLVEDWIDEGEERAWFLFEMTRTGA